MEKVVQNQIEIAFYFNLDHLLRRMPVNFHRTLYAIISSNLGIYRSID